MQILIFELFSPLSLNYFILKIYISVVALHFSCNSDSECTSGAHCVQQNVTLGKRCYCQEGYYEESLLHCSGMSFFLFDFLLQSSSKFIF